MNLHAEASARHFTITDGGVVIDNLPTPESSGEAEDRENLKRDYEQGVDAIVRQADHVVAAGVSGLSEVERGRAPDGGATTVQEAIDSQSGIEVPERGTDPLKTAAWWDSLDKAEQERLLDEDPASIGNLDGVPNAVRSEANLAALPGHLSQWRGKRDSLQARIDKLERKDLGGPGPSPHATEILELERELEGVTGKVEDLEAVRTAMYGEQETPLWRRHLLLLDPHAGPNVEAAVAFGDADRAENVALTVPGFTTTPRSTIEGMADQARQQVLDAEELGGRETASIAYIGYQAPQGADVAGNSVAHDGGENVADALTGLQVTSESDNQHLTLLGHSYGSNTAGVALQHLADEDVKSPVDDVVLYGSPGIDNLTPKVDGPNPGPPIRPDPELSELGIDEGNAYYMSAPADFVSEGWSPVPGKLGPTPDEWGMEELSTDEAMTVLGPRSGPSDAGFTWENDRIGWIRYENGQHSDYPDIHRTSGFNMAAIVAGTPEEAIR